MPRTPTLRAVMMLALSWALVIGLAGPAEAVETQAPQAAASGPAQVAQAPKAKRSSKKRKRSRKKKVVEAAPAADEAEATTKTEGGVGGLRRSNRMEFDARLIQGSTPEAGAVYLFERAPRQLPALVRLRQSWLDQIVTPVLGPGRLVAAGAEAKEAVK